MSHRLLMVIFKYEMLRKFCLVIHVIQVLIHARVSFYEGHLESS